MADSGSGNYVRITVAATDQAATADLDDLKGRLDELGAKVDTARVDVDDDEASVKLDRMNARLLELGEKVSRPRVTVAGAARAEAEIHALEVSLDHLGDKKEQLSEGSGGFFSSLLGQSSGSDAEGFMGKLGSILSLSPESLGGTAGGGAAIGVIGALAQGLTDAGIAAGGLAAALAPIASKIMPEITAAWGKWEAKIDATAAAKQAISEAGKAFGELLNAMTPLVTSMMPDLTRAFADIGKSAQSGGIKTFFEWMAENAPRAFDAVGEAARDFGNAIHAMQPWLSAAADAFKIFFHLIDAGFDLLGGVIDIFTGNWSAAAGKFSAVAGNITGAFKDLVNAASENLGAIVRFFEALPGKIMSELGSLPGLLVDAGRAMIDGLISGIEGEVGGLLSHVRSIASDISSAFGSVLRILSPSKVFEEHGRMIVAGLVQGIDSAAPLAASAINRLGNSVSGGFGAAGARPAIAGAAGSGGTIQLEVVGGSSAGFEQFMTQAIRQWVRVRGGGGPNSVQKAFGQRV
jgi:phage-related protein